MRNVKMFTHTDLDGVSCGILGTTYADRLGIFIDIEYVGYYDINERINEFLKDEESDIDKYHMILITDISVNKEIADMLDVIHMRTSGPRVVLLDHHPNLEWLNEYEWAKVDTKNTCGTKLLYEFLEMPSTPLLDYFVTNVTKYDTGNWDDVSLDLNNLMYIISSDRFVKTMVDRLLYHNTIHDLFSKTDRLLLMYDNEAMEKYFEIKDRNIGFTDVRMNPADESSALVKIGYVFADRYVSQLGKYLAEKYPDVDLVAIINPAAKSINLRTATEINLTEFAKFRGGGGHPKASGYPIDPIVLETFITGCF